MLQFLFLIIDVVIVVAFIAGPWIILTKLNVHWPDWLKDGIVGVIVFVIWSGKMWEDAWKTSLIRRLLVWNLCSFHSVICTGKTYCTRRPCTIM